MAQLLERELDLHPRVGLAGHEPNHAALVAGDIDLYAEYLGTALRRYVGHRPVTGAAATYRVVRDAARTRWNVEWLPAFGFNNTYAVVVRRELADALRLARVSDLLPHAAGLQLGATQQFLSSDPRLTFAPDGWTGFQRAFGLAFGGTLELSAEYGATFDALGAGAVDAVIDFPVNPRMVSLDLVELRDDRRYFAPYFAAPAVRGAWLAEYPAARATLERLAGRIDNRRMAELNHAVEMLGRDPHQVASDVVGGLTDADPGRRAVRRRAG